MSEPRKVYVTRYWQTDGIHVYEDARRPAPGGRVWVRSEDGPRLVEAADWTSTLELAQDRVRDKAASLLATIQYGERASLRRKQVERLKAILRVGAKVVEVNRG